VNRLVQEEPGLRLIQVFYAAGSGWVAIMERSEGAEEPGEPKTVPVQPAPKKAAPSQATLPKKNPKSPNARKS
jgi:hypothetical protein